MDPQADGTWDALKRSLVGLGVGAGLALWPTLVSTERVLTGAGFVLAGIHLSFMVVVWTVMSPP